MDEHREDHKTIQHPAVGPVTVDCKVLTDGSSELKIMIMKAAPGSADETRLRRTAIAGLQESRDRTGGDRTAHA